MWTYGQVVSLRDPCLAAWLGQHLPALLPHSLATPDVVTGSGMSWATSLHPLHQVSYMPNSLHMSLS
jgi:hypothetical protein